MSAQRLSTMKKYIDDKYDIHEKMAVGFECSFLMRVGNDDGHDSYTVMVTVAKVDGRMCTFSVKHHTKSENDMMNCFLSG